MRLVGRLPSTSGSRGGGGARGAGGRGAGGEGAGCEKCWKSYKKGGDRWWERVR